MTQRAGIDLAFEAHGDRGAAVLLLHGLMASARQWRALAHALAATHRVLAVDLRNHGDSPRHARMSYLEMADDVLRLIERQDLGRVRVVGHGVGGKVAMALALMYPYALSALVVVESTPEDDQRHCERLLAGWRDTAEPPAAAGDALALLARALHPAAQRDDAAVDARTNIGAVRLALADLGGFPRHLRHLSTDVPLHALFGAHSERAALGCRSDGSAFAPMFRRVSVETIGGAGHDVHTERPAKLLDRLRSYVADARPGAAPTPDPASRPQHRSPR